MATMDLLVTPIALLLQIEVIRAGHAFYHLLDAGFVPPARHGDHSVANQRVKPEIGAVAGQALVSSEVSAEIHRAALLGAEIGSINQ